MLKMLRQSVVALVALGVIVGVIYPLAVTGISQAFFSHKAGGSMIVQDNKDRRLRADRPAVQRSQGISGRAPRRRRRSPTTRRRPRAPIWGPPTRAPPARWKSASRPCAPPTPGNALVPVDLVTSSGSGLDPHISPAAAEYQVERVCKSQRADGEMSSVPWSPNTPRAANGAFWASRASTCWS